MFFKKKSVNEFEKGEVKENQIDNHINNDDLASDFLLSSLSENLKKLIKKAKNSGSVSKSMVEKAAEMDGLGVEEIDDALVLISEIGVNVKEEYDEGEELSLGEDDMSDDDLNLDDDDEDIEEESDSLYGVSKSKIENSTALKEFLSTHQEDDDFQGVDSRSSDPVRNYLRAMGSIELFLEQGKLRLQSVLKLEESL